MSIVVVDYDMGNVGSIINMLKKIGQPAKLSRAPEDIAAATKLILPGVGHFDAGMEKIRSLGLAEALTRKVVEERTPVLGICLGMQLLGERSAEGSAAGLGWIPSQSIRFQVDGLRVPHMGWNTVASDHWLFADLPADMRFYFVHSYHVVPVENQDAIATAKYGLSFCAAVGRGHILGVQFHPEKSHKFGMQLLRNFSSHDFC